MALQVILHLQSEDPILAEVEMMPSPADNFIRVTNPRRRDGKALPTMTEGMTSVIYPWSHVVFIEVMGTEEETRESTDAVISFFRESGGGGRR